MRYSMKDTLNTLKISHSMASKVDKSRRRLTESDIDVLAVLLQIFEPSKGYDQQIGMYGLEMLRKFRERPEMYHTPEGSLYSVLRKLEDENLINGWWGEEIKGSRRAARRRYYSINENGLERWKDMLKIEEMRSKVHSELSQQILQ